MQNPAWVALLRRFPVELHDSLALVLNTGAEIVLQSIPRIEREFVVVRGRMAGSLDAARIVIVPFDQIVYLAINKRMTEAEAQTFLGKPQALPAVPEEAEEPLLQEVAEEDVVSEVPAAPVAVVPPAVPAESAANGNGPAAKPGQVSKSILLARLRARLSKDGAGKLGDH